LTRKVCFRWRSRAFSLCLLLASAFLPAVARAQPAAGASDTESREREAEAACSGGRLDEGVRILAELFALTDDGNYIFNQARCYQKNGRAAEALARFDMYLKRPDADPAAAARARQYVAELRAGPGPAPAPGPAAPRPAPLEIEAAPPPAPSIGGTLRVAGLATAGAGMLALGAATYFGLQIGPISREARQIADQKNPADAQKLRDVNARGDQAELLQWVFLGVGATAVSTGALLYYLGVRAQSGPDLALGVSPLLLPGGGGALLRLAY
jgi:hypothetical protein